MMPVLLKSNGPHVWDNGVRSRRMLKRPDFSPNQSRRAKTRRSAG